MPPQQPENLQASGKKPLLKPVLGNTGLLQCMVPGRGTHTWLLHVPPQRMEKLREPGKGERGGGEGAYNQRFVCVILLNPLHNFRRQALREDYVACPRSCMETGSNADLSDSTPSPSGCGLFPLG